MDYTPAPSTDITAAFTDANFLAAVRTLVGKPTGSILYSDVSGITELDVNYEQLSNLNGIEYFTALQSLGCSANQLTMLDVSRNAALTHLKCDNNQLTTLDLSKNTALTNLDCGYNKLTTLDVSKNTALEWLHCNNNRLTTVDVSKNTALTTLACHRNQLTTLDVSKNTALIDLRCWNNQLTTLDLSKNTALRWLYGEYNQLTTLDVSKNTALQDLDCSSNQLTTLDISKNTALTHLQVQYNYLPSETAIIGLAASGLIERADVNELFAQRVFLCAEQYAVREKYSAPPRLWVKTFQNVLKERVVGASLRRCSEKVAPVFVRRECRY
ncbi:hypothetical protein FACS18949_01840 [Clostridia bacterium]|nr:hypothetical protein FACS18949_01840 [Clostridia bacterium]